MYRYMEKEKILQELEEKAKLINIELNEEQKEKFYNYMNLLIEWNKKINLTAITEPKEIILKHFIDSLTISKYIKDDSKIIDVGTGAGFPGIPLKIYNPTLKITLLDSLNKRIIFLKEVIQKLELKDIEAIHGRIEDIAQEKEYREKYDIVTSRAVSTLNVLSEYMIPFSKKEGKSICMKGIDIENELEDAKNAIKTLGGKTEQVEEFKLANEDIKRNIIIIKKEKSTPNKYPRKAGIPSKNPIKQDNVPRIDKIRQKS